MVIFCDSFFKGSRGDTVAIFRDKFFKVSVGTHIYMLYIYNMLTVMFCCCINYG